MKMTKLFAFAMMAFAFSSAIEIAPAHADGCGKDSGGGTVCQHTGAAGVTRCRWAKDGSYLGCKTTRY